MSDNPYAPPGAALEGDFESRYRGGHGDFEIGRCMSDAWAATWDNFPLWLGVGLVAMVCAALAAVTVIGFFLVLPVLLWGSIYFVLRMHDGRAQFGDLFAGFSRYGQALLSMLGLFLILVVIGLLGESVQIIGSLRQNPVLTSIGVAINLAFAVFITSRLNFAYFFAVDANASPLEALSRAWSTTGPAKWKVAGLLLLSPLIFIAGLLALVIGVVPATVMVYLMWVSAYRQMVGTHAPA